MCMDKKRTERQESMDLYGTWFAKGMTSSEIVEKCNQQIAKYEKWEANLEELKTKKSQEAQKLNQKTKEIIEKLDSLTEEERNAFFRNYKFNNVTPEKLRK